jgi:hypothetical protein
MSRLSDVGYKVFVDIGERYVLCVDRHNVIRSFTGDLEEGYLSDSERWCDTSGRGVIEGTLRAGSYVTARTLEGEVLCIDGRSLEDVVIDTVIAVPIPSLDAVEIALPVDVALAMARVRE